MEVLEIEKKRIASYDFEEVENDVYMRGDIKLVYEGINCVEVSINGVQFKKLLSYKYLERLIEMYEGN